MLVHTSLDKEEHNILRESFTRRPKINHSLPYGVYQTELLEQRIIKGYLMNDEYSIREMSTESIHISTCWTLEYIRKYS